MRTVVIAKVFFFITTSTLLLLLLLMLRNNQRLIYLEKNDEIQKFLLESEFQEIMDKENAIKGAVQAITTTVKEVSKDLKYILLWTSPRSVPFVYMGEGQQGFIANGCPYTNCYSTGNRSLFGDLTNFDLVAFNAPQLIRIGQDELPKIRSPHQKYVLSSIESAGNYPICHDTFNGFFNWTWTYKLSSDARWGYLVVRDKEQRIIGPNVEMHWMKREDMDPVSEELKYQLQGKTEAAAWFVSNCHTKSNRETFVKNLQAELKTYNLDIDIYGKCGKLRCERNNEDVCNDIIKKKYYFYLSFENSFAEDYVTEKLLHALQNDAVPIVYGGANYTRFMPDGIYLNAKELGIKELAKKMNELINNPSEYAEYFRWKNHYSFYRRMQSVETNDYCIFCAMLNNKELVEKKTVYDDFKKWWMADRCSS